MTKINKKWQIGLSFILCPLSFSVALTSCQFEDDDYFEEPAAQRIETTIADIQKTLVNAPNGWVMQFFTGTDVIEGFNLFARFESGGKVTIAGDHRYLRDGRANRYTEYSSLYQMLKEDGPVLAFNTWNDVLTPFVDPVDYTAAPGILVKDGEGMKGDHNFVVISYSADEVLLRGERHSARVRLIPCGSSWEDYISATATLKDYIASADVTNYYVTNGTDTLYFKDLRNGTFTYCERINDPLFPSTVNCVFTPQGFRLHHENNIKGTKFQEFRMAADSTCLVSEDDSVRVIACWDTYVVKRVASTPAKKSPWIFDTELFSERQKVIYDSIATAINKANKNWSLANIGMGSTTGSGSVSGLVLTAYLNAKMTSTRSAGMSMNIEKTAFGQMKINSENASFDSNVTAFIKNGVKGLDELLQSFAATLDGTYTITPNNYFGPTGALFTPIDNGTKFQLK